MRAEESRVLVMAPVGQDAEAMAGMLKGDGMLVEACAGVGKCLEWLEVGAGAVLLTEEALELPGAEELLGSFTRQPAWSELPLIILTSGGESRSARLLDIAAEVAGGVTLLERPMRPGTLLQAVRVALRSRRRQYEVRDLLAERERAAEVLRRNEMRQGYLLKLSDALRGVADAVEMQEQAAQVLGEELSAERVVYFEVSAGDYVIERDYANGVPHLCGRFQMALFGLRLSEAYQAGETVVAPDVENDARLSLPERARYLAIQIGAHVGVPLVKQGRLVAGLGVHASHPREWTADEVDLVEQTAERTWAAVERARAEQALRLANERLSYHVQNTPLAVVEFDSELKVCAWSEGAERMFGWAAADVIGRPMWEIPWICEEDRGKVECVSAGLESGQTPRSVSPNRNLRKDGQVIWCEWYNSSLKDSSGNMQSILSLVLDVTKRKEAEAVLARGRQELERLVEERTAALRELVGELEHFSYSITHDMRAPLRAMMGFAEVARELGSSGERHEQKLFLDRIQTAARRMDLLITDALSYSKAVRSELPLAPVDLERLLRGMVDTYPELQGAQGGIRIEPELPLVMGNEAGLTQCFSNLLGNAVKFARPGEAPEVRVWAQRLGSAERGAGNEDRNGEWVRVWVEDRGIGIGPKMLPRVFDMFARGASPQAGTGIGLALVRKVAERMGGRVGVESEEGRGSRFWLELPAGDVRGRRGLP